MRQLAKQTSKNKRFAALLAVRSEPFCAQHKAAQAGEASPRCRKQALRDLLMLPVQHIVRYALYFKGLPCDGRCSLMARRHQEGHVPRTPGLRQRCQPA